jgi:hypothetical protein
VPYSSHPGKEEIKKQKNAISIFLPYTVRSNSFTYRYISMLIDTTHPRAKTRSARTPHANDPLDSALSKPECTSACKHLHADHNCLVEFYSVARLN